ncbi:hypothetical protein EDD85DRAFT_775295, partial [Armillaria nabsnona]
YDIPRNEIIIAEKCYVHAPAKRLICSKYFLFKPRKRSRLRQQPRTAISKAVKASLERLQINYIDLLQIHRYTS